jgi:hypothetical protein
MNLTRLALIASLALAPAAVFAQTTTATTPTPGQHDYDINQRKTDQQDRIAQGVRSGQLTAGETSHLETQEAGINKKSAACVPRTTATSPKPIVRPSTSNRIRNPAASTATNTTVRSAKF